MATVYGSELALKYSSAEQVFELNVKSPRPSGVGLFDVGIAE